MNEYSEITGKPAKDHPDLWEEKLQYFKFRDELWKLKITVFGGAVGSVIGLWEKAEPYLWLLAVLPLLSWSIDYLIRGYDHRIAAIAKFFYDGGDDYEHFLRRSENRHLGSLLFGDVAIIAFSFIVYFGVFQVGLKTLSSHGNLLIVSSVLGLILSACTEYFYFKEYSRLFPRKNKEQGPSDINQNQKTPNSWTLSSDTTAI